MSLEESLRMTIRALLAVQGQTQRDLAKTMGVSFQSINLKLNGKSKFSVIDLEGLGAYWGIPAADLLRGPNHALHLLVNVRKANHAA